jgi:hypothetical protein
MEKTMEVEEVTRREEEDNEAKIIDEVRQNNPGVKIFKTKAPYVGLYLFRPQLLSDVKVATEEVDKFVNERIKSLGGQQTVEALPLEERTRIARETDAEAGDISNLITLKKCVLYPTNFAQTIDDDKVESGVIPMLLEKILEVSGWTDVEVTEV